MIIQRSAPGPSYSTDPVARSVRSFIAAPAAPRSGRDESAAGAPGPLRLAQLYPALFASDAAPAHPIGATRRLALRLGLAATAIVTFAALHH